MTLPIIKFIITNDRMYIINFQCKNSRYSWIMAAFYSMRYESQELSPKSFEIVEQRTD